MGLRGMVVPARLVATVALHNGEHQIVVGTARVTCHHELVRVTIVGGRTHGDITAVVKHGDFASIEEELVRVRAWGFIPRGNHLEMHVLEIVLKEQ